MGEPRTVKPTCFAIMPFKVRDADLVQYRDDANHWREVYEGLIVPAIDMAGLVAQRDDDDYATRLVGEGIWKKIEQADIVLCDMSSHNPNVHLELGWALRANKRIVLIKDEVTSFNFDLNQYYTYQYVSSLQPTALKQAVADLSKVIEATLADDVANYSMVAKLELSERAEDAASEGNLEIGMLQEILGEVRAVRRDGVRSSRAANEPERVFLKVNHPSGIAAALVGTTWRKITGLEEVFFISESEFAYTSVGRQEWIHNRFSVDPSSGRMTMHWPQDDFLTECRFDSTFSQINELNTSEPPWILIATKPYIHPSFT